MNNIELDKTHIEAIGHFLAYYRNDLRYFKSFKSEYIDGKKTKLIYPYDTNKSDAPYLWNFLNDFRVLRNLGIKNGQRDTFIKAFNDYNFSNVESKDVDDFRKTDMARGPNSKGIENHISLSSKLMMLANPWEIIPFDSRAQRAVGYKSTGNKSYKDYFNKVKKFREKHEEDLFKMHNVVEQYAKVIEADFKGDLPKIGGIRKNRLLDKLMWVSGA